MKISTAYSTVYKRTIRATTSGLMKAMPTMHMKNDYRYECMSNLHTGTSNIKLLASVGKCGKVILSTSLNITFDKNEQAAAANEREWEKKKWKNIHNMNENRFSSRNEHRHAVKKYTKTMVDMLPRATVSFDTWHKFTSTMIICFNFHCWFHFNFPQIGKLVQHFI